MTEPLHPEPEFRPGDSPASGASRPFSQSEPPVAAPDAFDAELRLIAEQAQMLTLASGAAIALRHGDLMVCRARSGTTAPELGACLDTQSGLSGECVRTGKTLICDDTENDPRVNLDACRYLKIRSIAVLPLCLEREVLGVFEVFAAHPGAFSSNEVAALNSMRDLVLSVIRPAPQPAPQAAVSAALAARARGETATAKPYPAVIQDPGDDLICELPRGHAEGEDDPLMRAFELLKSGRSNGSAEPAAIAPVATSTPTPVPTVTPTADPDDDLICEIETGRGARLLEFAAGPEHGEGLSAFAPAPLRPPERVISRKLIVAGAAAVVLGLAWLGWCNRPQQQATSVAPSGIVQAASNPVEAPKAAADIPTPASLPASAAQPSTAQGDAPATAEPSADESNPAPTEPLPAAAIEDAPPPPRAKRSSPASRPVPPKPKLATRNTRRPSGDHESVPDAPGRQIVPDLSPSPMVQRNKPSPVASQSAPVPGNLDPPATTMAAAKLAPPATSPHPEPPVAASNPQSQSPGQLSLSQAVVTANPQMDGGEALSRDGIRLLHSSAQAGDANAQLALAVRYANGEGVRQSYPEALKWFTRAQAHGVVIVSGSPAEQAWSKVQAWEQGRAAKR